jgi:hypothetical protein
MQSNGHAHVFVCVSTNHCVCVCVSCMRESFDNGKDCLCIHWRGNPWYQYRHRLSMNKCIYLSIRATSLSDAHTHTNTFPMAILPTICVRMRMRVFVWASFWMLLGYLPVIRQQIIMPCTTVCVCVCVCVCIRQRHHSYVHERETHTVTDSDREGDTFTHIHTFFHSLSLSLSLYLSISPSLSSRSCSIFLDLSSVTEKWKELCRMPDHCDVITPPIDILQERETHRIFQKRHTHPWFWMVVCRSPAI